MKATKKIMMRSVFSILLVCICFHSWAQHHDMDQKENTASERYRIVTDRNLYIAGEKINFRIFNLTSESLKEIDWSKTFYAELISPSGNSLEQVKLLLDNSGAAGFITIPTNIASGIYYVKGYTRWMRNWGPASYTYVSVEIINPYIRMVLPVDTTSEFTVSMEKHRVNPVRELHGSLDENPERRSTTSLKLSNNGSDEPLDLCLSVVRKQSRKPQWISVTGTSELTRSNVEYLPETRGVSLAGRVRFSESGLPAEFAVVFLSLLGSDREFHCNYADSEGRFVFALQEKFGKDDLFISAHHPSENGLELFIEQDYCKEPVLLPSFPLEVDESNLSFLSEMSEQAQINALYYPARESAKENNRPEKFFYGRPSIVVAFDDFIKLPTMEEYFTEVTPQVSLRGSGNRKRLRVSGNHPDLDIYPPLVMIDGVAIPDVQSVLSVSPRNIDRIEIVDAPYIRGNITFGGIINLISRQDDLGMINLPESGVLVNYTMYEHPSDQSSLVVDKNLPDVRNTLYWDPKLKVDPGRDTTIHFQTSDVKGEYQVVIAGADSRGESFEKVIPFIVK